MIVKHSEVEKLNYVINTKLKEISILKDELVDLGKDEQIFQLTKQISELKNRGFFARLFNI